MGLQRSDWILTAKLVAAGGPFAFIVGAVLALSAPVITDPTPLPTFPPSSPIVIVVPPSPPPVKETTTVPRHAATEKPSTIAPAPAAPKPPRATSAVPTPTPEPTTPAVPTPTQQVVTPSPVAPSDTPIYDGLVQENIGRDPSYEAPHEGR
jgi:hypothetical protein